MLPPATRPGRTSAPVDLSAASDRRREARLSADVLGLDADAQLDVGVHVRVINISVGGALIEQQEWLRPGTVTELRLLRPVRGEHPEKLAASGAVLRSWVHRLSPLCYRSAIAFARVGAHAAQEAAVVEDQPHR